MLRGGSSGPAGLLWVQQGATEIDGGTKTKKDDERKVREDVLASVTGDEVELLTGGRRMVRVLDKTLSDLDRLVTSTGKPVEGSQTLNISSTEIFEIPNIGIFTITPGSLESADEMLGELRTAHENLSTKLGKLDFLSLSKAIEQQNLFKAKFSTLMIKKAELEAHSPEGLERLR